VPFALSVRNMRQLDLLGGEVEQCLFCKIAKGAIPSLGVFEDGISFAFLDNKPLFPGHCLLVPKAHISALQDMSADILAPLLGNVQLMSTAIEAAMKAEGSFVGINNRVSQSIPHLHIHIVPRNRGDGLKGFFWPRTKYSDEKAARDVQQAIRAAVGRLKPGAAAQ